MLVFLKILERRKFNDYEMLAGGPMANQQRVNLLGVSIDNISVEEVIAFILNAIDVNFPAIASNVNVHALNIAYERPWFRDFLSESHLVFCDGFGVDRGKHETNNS